MASCRRQKLHSMIDRAVQQFAVMEVLIRRWPVLSLHHHDARRNQIGHSQYSIKIAHHQVSVGSLCSRSHRKVRYQRRGQSNQPEPGRLPSRAIKNAAGIAVEHNHDEHRASSHRGRQFIPA